MAHSRRAFLALVVTLSGVPLAAQSAGVAGKWDLLVTSPHGEIRMGLDLKQDGAAITGTLLNFRGQDLAVTGQYAGGQLSLSTPDDELALSAQLKDDGSLAGYLSTSMGDLTWTGRRAKASR